MKVYVIMISERFPKGHIAEGKPTGFEDLILRRHKIHTLRLNAALWEKRAAKIASGEACISLRKWVGKAYSSQQIEIARLDRSHGVGVEVFSLDEWQRQNKLSEVWYNDGLNLDNFHSWFKNVPKTKPLACIHFTPFRYN